jgi:hypothetical protein
MSGGIGWNMATITAIFTVPGATFFECFVGWMSGGQIGGFDPLDSRNEGVAGQSGGHQFAQCL